VRAHLVLLAAAAGCGGSPAPDALAALEREYAVRGDVCLSRAALAVDGAGDLLVAYQETSCDVGTGERIGLAYRVRRWDGAALRDVGFPLPVPASTRVVPPLLVSRSGGETTAVTAEGAFRWRGGEWVPVAASDLAASAP
jgi:hypothetical protein